MTIRGASKVPKPSYGPHVILLFVLSFAAFLLSYVPPAIPWRRAEHSSILVTFSSPFIASINFLYLNPEPGSTGAQTTFGAFGWCGTGYCLPSKVGYEYDHLLE